MNAKTIPEMLLQVCSKYEVTAFMAKTDFFGTNEQKEFINISHKQLLEKIECLALALSELGIHFGDKVGIASENRIEWVIADLAIVSLGAVDVPVFPILSAKQEEYIFEHAEVSAVFVSNNFQLQKLLQVKDNISSLRHIIVMNEDFKSDEVYVKSIKTLIERGEQLKSAEERKKWFSQKALKVNPEDLLTIIYTSGTMGEPKGVMLTHHNLISDIKGTIDILGDLYGETALSFLPLCHAFERAGGFYTLFSSGATIAIAESIEAVPSNIKEVRPTIIPTVPRLLETIRKKILTTISKEKKSKQVIFNWAMKVGMQYAKANLDGKVGLILKSKYNLAYKLVFSKMREKMGGRLHLFFSGGAALSEEVTLFFMAMGVNILQGYGLTEASPIVTINAPSTNEPGTIGIPLPNIETKIADDGELLIRGPIVMKGYYKSPEDTEMAIDEDGWLYTGDIVRRTEKGNLTITDRKKNIFVSSGGKNIAPQMIENLLCQSRFLQHCVLIGENREYCTALLTPDFEQLKLLAQDLQIDFQNEEDLILNSKIIKHIKDELDFYQKDLSKYEKVRRFQMLPKPFSVDTGELTPKLSIRRHVVERKYSDLIDKMYNE